MRIELPPVISIEKMFEIIARAVADPSEFNLKRMQAAFLRPAMKLVHRYCSSEDYFNIAVIAIIEATPYVIRERLDPNHVVNYMRVKIKEKILDQLNRDHLIRVPPKMYKRGVRVNVGSLTGDEISREINLSDYSLLEQEVIKRLMINLTGKEICHELNLSKAKYYMIRNKIRETLL